MMISNNNYLDNAEPNKNKDLNQIVVTVIRILSCRGQDLYRPYESYPALTGFNNEKIIFTN